MRPLPQCLKNKNVSQMPLRIRHVLSQVQQQVKLFISFCLGWLQISESRKAFPFRCPAYHHRYNATKVHIRNSRQVHTRVGNRGPDPCKNPTRTRRFRGRVGFDFFDFGFFRVGYPKALRTSTFFGDPRKQMKKPECPFSSI